MFYWCKLNFCENGDLYRRTAIKSCEDKDIIKMLAGLVRSHAWSCDTAEAALLRFEKMQNVTGKDCERVVLRTHWNPETMNVDVLEAEYYVKDKQLVRVDEGGITTVDARYFHYQVLDFLKSGADSRIPNTYPKHKPYQGKTHKRGGHWHWQAGIRRNLQDISMHRVRAKRASKYRGSVDFDPKFHATENNWKEAKCRHQYEWHKKKHQDRMYLPEEEPIEEMECGTDDGFISAY